MPEKGYENLDQDIELLWMELSEGAFLEFEKGKFVSASEQWQKAYKIAEDLDANDPRLACSLNNLANGYRIEEDWEGAERLYRQALKCWKASSEWVEKMHLVQRARSSLFHLRLEQKHRDQYNTIERSKYRKILLGGQGGTYNNLAELCQATNRLQEAKKFYDQALQERMSSMGEKERGVRIIRKNKDIFSQKLPDREDRDAQPQNAPDVLPFSSQAQQNGWLVDLPPEFTDEGRLMAAVLLTHLISHSYLSETMSN